MKKGLLYILLLICTGSFFVSCSKKNTLTVNSAMSATIGSYNFNATTMQPATIKPQLNDSATSLIIAGREDVTGNQIILTIIKYKNKAATFSIANGEATATYSINGTSAPAVSGIVTVKDPGGNAINGYFSFTTPTGNTVTNGTFTIGRPWVY